MGVLIPPGFALAALRFSLVGDPEEMITTYGIDLGAMGLSGNDAATQVASAWLSGFSQADMQSNWSFVGVTTYEGQDGGPSLVYGHTSNVGGGGTGTATLPANCAYLVRKRTGRGGRSGSGRNFIPCAYGQEADVNSLGVLSSGAFTAIQGNLDAFFDFLSDDVLVLLHDESSPVATPDVITGLELQPQIATQRQRLRR